MTSSDPQKGETGEVGAKGDPGEIGIEGERGERGRRGFRGGLDGSTTKGFILASAIFLIVVYALNFDRRSDLIGVCERGNVRVGVLYDFLRGAESARIDDRDFATAKTYGDLADSLVLATPEEERVTAARPESNCGETFPKPFPFG